MARRSYRSASIFTRGPYSTKQPENDKDPNRSGTNWEGVHAATSDLGGMIRTGFDGLAKLFGLTGILDVLDGEADGTFDPGAVWDNIVGAVPAFLTNILGIIKSAPLPGINIIGLLRPGAIPLIGTGQIGDSEEELLVNPEFIGVDALTGAGEFTLDAADVPPGSKAGAQSAVTTANGTSKDLLSQPAIRVTEKQKLKLRWYAKWSAITSTGTPARFGLSAYNAAGDVVVQPDLVSEAASGTLGWHEITSQWTVPPNVATVRLRYTLGSSATAGTVKYGRGSVKKAAGLRTGLIVDEDGNGLPDVIDDIRDKAESALTGLLDKVTNGQWSSLLSTLGGGFGATLAGIGDRLSDMLHSASTLNGSNIGIGNVADSFVSGVRQTLNNLVRGIFNVDANPDGSDFTHTDAQLAISNQSDALSGLAARITQLETTYTSGVADGDDFERTNLASRYLIWYSGSGGGSVGSPDGHNATYQPDGFGNRDYICVLDDGVGVRSNTPYQRILLALNSKAAYAFGIGGHNDVWFRITDASTSLANITGIRMRFGADGSLRLHRFLGGAGVELNSYPPGSIVAPGPGMIIGGEAGRPGVNIRQFRMIIGSNGVMDFPEVGTASVADGTALRWGFGGSVRGQLLPIPVTQRVPAGIRQWTVMDQ